VELIAVNFEIFRLQKSSERNVAGGEDSDCSTDCRRRRVILLAMADRRGKHDKQVTVPDAVTVGARSDIATVTVTGSDCTGGNREKCVLREGKQLLSCTESVRLIVGEQRRVW